MACTTGLTELLKTVMPKKITIAVGPAILREEAVRIPARAFPRSGVGTLRHVRPLVVRAAGGGLSISRLSAINRSARVSLVVAAARPHLRALPPTVIGSFRARSIKSQPAEPTHELSRLW